MDKNVKAVLGISAAAILSWLLFFRKKAGKAATPDATVRLSIASAGYSGEYGAIPVLVEGSTGNQAIVTVTNNSVYAGTTIKAPFTFNVGINIQVPDGTYWKSNLGTLFLAAGATGTYTWTFDIAYGAVTGAGKAYAHIANPAVPLTVIASAIPIAVTVNAAAGVNVTLWARNAPSLVKYWIAMCATYPSSDFIPKANPIVWNNIPANTSQQWVIFGGYDANFQPVSTPNAWVGIGFSTPFVNGKTYYWDFATGILLDEYFNWM